MPTPNKHDATALLAARLEEALHEPVHGLEELHRGVGGIVLTGSAAPRGRFVVKLPVAPGLDLRTEARMLNILRRAALPVPEVLYAERSMLVLEYIPSDVNRSMRFEEDVADALVALHSHSSPNSQFGLAEASYLGSILQDNAWLPGWVAFFRDRRLLAALRQCIDLGHLPLALAVRVEMLAGRLGSLLPNSPQASLIHGDVWQGNVLSRGGRLAAFLDPSPSFSDAEVELAFITLFETFSDSFFERYARSRPISPEFWSTRRHVYNVYPLLIHVALFPGEYLGELDQTLQRLGFAAS